MKIAIKKNMRSVKRNHLAPFKWSFLNRSRDSYHVYYERGAAVILSRLAAKYGTDKDNLPSNGRNSHSYCEFYDSIFKNRRNWIETVLEFGIGSVNPLFKNNMGANGKPGASLRMWREYFGNAQIVGADIDKDILFQEDRIRTFYVDQTNIDSLDSLAGKLSNVDVIIDDGLHTLEAGRKTFSSFFTKLKIGGTYVIEDVSWEYAEELLSSVEGKNRIVNFVRLESESISLLGNNNLIVIEKK